MTSATGTPLDGPLGPSLIKVIRGNPTREEVAAVAALLLALNDEPRRRARRAARTRATSWTAARSNSWSPRSWVSRE
ncbi:acyl-CoA carboxylase subunit epsilon [Streptomyces sp. SID4931]|nr:acyl-CoA carboxylase subunit epsilon [Streptomyces sp. SID4931]SCF87656.1 Acyl-CoA carboxylase epsilon subunit [Streptomyces sp. Ncost-T6T-2b]